jgi:hypothetical protein
MHWLLSDILWLASRWAVALVVAVPVWWCVDRWAVAPLLETIQSTTEEVK